MTTTQKIAAVIAVTLFLCGMAAQCRTRDKPEYVIVTNEHVVAAGDTLWSIAREYCPEDMDIREYIDDIKTRNGLNGTIIRDGEAIEVWTYKEITDD